MTQRKLRVAIDVGGTFTDATLLDPEGHRITVAKVFTTPQDRAEGVLDAIQRVLDLAQSAPSDVRDVVHGSTTGTNALIERTGAKTGFLTTAGFRDVLEIGRIQRPMEGLYDVSVDRPKPLVPRALCLEARERIDAQGEVLVPLDEDTVCSAASKFCAAGVESLAICLLSAYRNPVHERRAAEILAASLPGVAISVSHMISPEYREYERASTTVMNAYLTPIMNAYLDRLEPSLVEALGPARLFMIQANGGSTSVEVARSNAVTTVNSGPAGGVVAAAFYGRYHARGRVVSVDMGGTSFDIGLVEDGQSKVTTEGSFQGLPVKIPIIDLHIIGAGGGSVAWIDSGGALNVGPRSAGADPGPACYGRGGQEATVTDANLVLGRLNPDYFNGGRTPLFPELAHASISPLAERLGMGLEETASGILKVVNANMTKGIATITIQRGIDVRKFSLLSFGGAGGVHAVDLARDLEMEEAIVPPYPGTFSALGLLVTDMRHDYVSAVGVTISGEADPAALEAGFSQMETAAKEQLLGEGFAEERIRCVRSADLKVVGQTYELNVELPTRTPLDRAGLEALVASFTQLYRERYAFVFEGEAIELVNLRLAAYGLSEAVELPVHPEQAADPKSALKGSRQVWFEGSGWLDTPIYERELLSAGMRISGPAVIEEETSCSLLPPDSRARVAPDLGLFITWRQGR